MSHAAVNWVLNELNLKGIAPAERWVLMVLADYADREAWTCYPSHKTLAEACDVSSRSVQTHLAKLEERGLISRAKRYREDGSQTSDLISLHRVENSATPGGNGCSGGRKIIPAGVAKPAGQEPLSEDPLSEEPKNISTDDADEIFLFPTPAVEKRAPAEFDIFWKAYPRRVGRGQAEKAFAAARKVASFDDITSGAVAYAKRRAGEDPQFTKHPTTWLNGKCWTDEEEPAHERQIRNTADPRGDARAASHQRRTNACLAGLAEAFDGAGGRDRSAF